MIHLACTHGNLGYWDYYSTVMKVEDIVSKDRIITVAESEELFTHNINKVLQREIDNKRIRSITDYITETDERFFGSIVVAIHKGEPKWTEIDLNRRFEIEGISIDDFSINFLQSKFGVLTLFGNEEIFALDGQHRLLGLRKAYEKDPEEVGKLEISLLFVGHKHDELKKTRRLFTVLNKYAEKPKGAELIILDEDDVRAIVTRMLASDHEQLSKEKAISDSKSAALSPSDTKSFTTLVTINMVNNTLFRKNKSFYVKRPKDEVIDQFYLDSVGYWDALFEAYPELVRFINGEDGVEINDKPISRNHETGGSLLLRPIGQRLLASAYTLFQENERELFIRKLRLIDFNLSSGNWKYLVWNDKILKGKITLQKNVLLYLFGKFDNEEYINREMTELYESFNEEYDNHLVPVN